MCLYNLSFLFCLFASVVPLILLFCLCGGAAGAGDFKAIPYDTKQQLISYHTEGQGEDKVLHGGEQSFTFKSEGRKV